MAIQETRLDRGHGTRTLQPIGSSISIKMPNAARLRVSAKMFWKLCRENPDLRLERTSKGNLVVMAPAGSDSGGRNMDLSGQLWLWNRTAQMGKVFDSSTGFTLPNGAIVSADASWIRMDRWGAVPSEQREKFAPICPDFVVELRSPSDRLKPLRRKMREYIAQGVRLGWLLDPIRAKVEIYRPEQEVEVFDRPASLSGEEVLPGFVLDLQGILFDRAT